MSDIVERLNFLADDNYEMLGNIHEPLLEAADEITRLRAENEKLRALAAKADEAIARQQQDLEEATDRAADCDTLRAENEKLRKELDEAQREITQLYEDAAGDSI